MQHDAERLIDLVALGLVTPDSIRTSIIQVECANNWMDRVRARAHRVMAEVEKATPAAGS